MIPFLYTAILATLLGPQAPAVRPCQVGYLPKETKIVAVVGDPSGPALVRRVSDNVVVMKLECGSAQVDRDTGDAVRRLDLTPLTKSGKYRVEVPGVGVSDPFDVDDAVYASPLWLTMLSFTGQRCGIAVDLGPKFPQYRHAACHTSDASFDKSAGRTGTKRVTGGWHDAGDYGRYVVNAGVSTSTLLWAYEQNSKALAPLKLDLPDHNPKVPDFLTEVRWNLDWMLGMQDDDGGVWHKETSAYHAGFVMPEKDRNAMLIIGSGNAPFKVTTATADFAATFAVAARIYPKFDAAYAKRCLDVAERAWTWAVAHPQSLVLKNPAGIGTGWYSDDDPTDELLWASAELFKTTGKAEYNRYFLDHCSKWSPFISTTRIPGWAEVSCYAMLTYAESGQKSADPKVVRAITADASKTADEFLRRANGNGYRIPLTPNDYGWGSNGCLANMALMLESTSRIAHRPELKNAARDCLHYLFGRNTFATSFVTQIGTRWAMHPHHRPSEADGVEQPWPGLLVGGPNSEGKPLPARQWEDSRSNFKVNEVAINWNAPLVYVLACEVNSRAVKSLR